MDVSGSEMALREGIGKWASLVVGLLIIGSGPSLLRAQVAPSAPLAEAVDPAAQAVASVVKGIVSYTRWPNGATTLRLCLTAEPKFASVLLHGWTSNDGVKVNAQARAVLDPQLGSECDIVYSGALTAPERLALATAVNGHPVLTISEFNQQCAVGSMFCLRFEQGRVSFDINLDAVSRSGVRVHPSVLRLQDARTPPP